MTVESMDTTTGTATAGTPIVASPSAPEGTATAGTPTEAPATALPKTNTSSPSTTGEHPASIPESSEVTKPEGSEQPANPWESNDNVYKKRFNDVLGNAQRTYQEKQQLEQRYQQLETQHRAMQEAEAARAKQLQLKDWHPRSPNYQQTKAVNDRVDNYIKAKSALAQEMQTPEVLRSLAEQFGVTADDAKVYHQIQNDRKQTQENLLSDPEAFFDRMFESRMTAKLQEYESFNQARSSAESFLKDPKIQPLIQKYAVDMDRMMDPQVPGRDKALRIAQLMAENEAMKAKLGEGAIEAAQAEAQQALRHGGNTSGRRAPIGKDSVIADPVKHFTSKGLKGADLAMALARYNASQTK